MKPALFLVAALLLSQVATAAPRAGTLPEALPHLERGIQLCDEGALDQSIAELEIAYSIDPSADVCYALGQAFRKKESCGKAIIYYRCAVANAPSETFARAAQYQIGRCVVEAPKESTPELGAKADEGATRVDGTRATGREPAAPAVAQAAVAGGPRWWRDPAGGALLGLGLGASLAGAVLLGHAEALASGAQVDLEAYRAAQSVGAERIAGAITLAAGGVLLIGSVVRYVVVGRRH